MALTWGRLSQGHRLWIIALLIPLILYLYLSERYSWKVKVLGVATPQTYTYDVGNPKLAAVQWLDFLPDGRRLLVAREDNIIEKVTDETGESIVARGLVEIWDVGSQSIQSTLLERKDYDSMPSVWVEDVARSADGRLLATVNRDHKIRLWDTATGRKLAEIDPNRDSTYPPGQQVAFATIAFIGNDTLITTSSYHSRVLSYNVVTHAIQAAPLQLAPDAPVAFSVDGKMACTRVKSMSPNVSGNHLAVYELATGRCLRTIPVDRWERLADGAFSPDNKYVVTERQDLTKRQGHAIVWDIQAASVIHHSLAPINLGPVAFSHSGTLLALARENVVELWRVGSWKLLRQLPHHDKVTSIAFSPLDDHIGVGFDDSSVKVWRIE